LVALASAACNPKALSSDARAGADKAADSLQRAWEYRDESRVLYELRLMDAEKAVGEMPGTDQPTRWTGGPNPDWEVSQKANACLLELKTYRSLLELANLQNDAIRLSGRDSGELKNTISRAYTAASDTRMCIKDVRMWP